ncbi:UDP-sugar-dependent glycosyltransferase 52 isoform X2 [Tripterygium wilfordii]|uniref:UDP-sugar-dependent glycosyltransferase 52 isoform X2 n=1 Tax=Tripterygium wilfordii TaxID=458696 RepID=UPI0018F82E9A|nr:UDP-sugar-dependent glycosyltransferase 52 isoform X2 [Tripterygium wilfordii]
MKIMKVQKKILTSEHRRECYSVVENVFGHGPSMEGDFIVINFFALEGWSLAELFNVRCVVAAPYVVPYSAPSSFERQFRKELPLLYKYLQEAPFNRVCWRDVIHWMWPLFTENWGTWRSDELKLSPCPFTDPVTGLPTWHHRASSPLLLYGFSQEVVECPDYWPSNVHVCGFWFLPIEWQFSCRECAEKAVHYSSQHKRTEEEMCSAHADLFSFLNGPSSLPPIFIGLSSVGSMGLLKNPHALLRVLQTVLETTSHRFILFTAAYEPLEAAVWEVSMETASSLKHYSQASSHKNQMNSCKDGISLFDNRLFCYSGMIPYNWLLPRCSLAIHHGGSGSTAASLCAGIPQVICPFMLDQFYWAEKMFWLGVSPQPLKRNCLIPDKLDDTSVREASSVISKSIHDALSSKVRARASEIAGQISLEDGLVEAVNILKQEISSN